MYGRLKRGFERFCEGVRYLILNIREMIRGQNCAATGCVSPARQDVAADQLVKQPHALFSPLGLQRRIRQVRCEVNNIVSRGYRRGIAF